MKEKSFFAFPPFVYCRFVQDGSVFIQALAMGSVIVCGYAKGASLPPLSPNLAEPKAPTRTIEDEEGNEKKIEVCTSLAAGNITCLCNMCNL